jgi:hypothetical protein
MRKGKEFHKGIRKNILLLADKSLESDPDQDHACHNKCENKEHKGKI